jgi:hypothetical protein
MYYLFFPNTVNLEDMYKILSQTNNEWIQFTEIKQNTVLPNCIVIKSNMYGQMGVKSAVKTLLEKIGYDGPYQLLKLLAREHTLI